MPHGKSPVLYIEPPVDVTLKPEKKFDRNIPLGASYISCLDSSDIIIQVPGAKRFFYVYDLNVQDTLCSFLSKGRASNEAISCSGAHVHDDNEVDVFTPDKLLCFKIDTGSPKPVKLTSSTPFKKISNEGVIYRIFKTKDGMLYYLKDNMGGISYILTNDEGNETYDIFGSNTKFIQNNWDYLSHSTVVSADGNKMAMFMKHFDKVHFLDLQSGEFHTSSLSWIPDRKVINAGKENMPRTYSYACCSQECLYAIYNRPDASKEIHEFDWDGNLLRRISLEEDIWNIAVSKDGKYLFVISSDEIIHQYPLTCS